jgi:hypothetical protein
MGKNIKKVGINEGKTRLSPEASKLRKLSGTYEYCNSPERNTWKVV